MSVPNHNLSSLFPGLYVVSKQTTELPGQTTIVGVYANYQLAQRALEPGMQLHGPFCLVGDTLSDRSPPFKRPFSGCPPSHDPLYHHPSRKRPRSEKDGFFFHDPGSFDP